MKIALPTIDLPAGAPTDRVITTCKIVFNTPGGTLYADREVWHRGNREVALYNDGRLFKTLYRDEILTRYFQTITFFPCPELGAEDPQAQFLTLLDGAMA